MYTTANRKKGMDMNPHQQDEDEIVADEFENCMTKNNSCESL